jgi:hypothetical protein
MRSIMCGQEEGGIASQCVSQRKSQTHDAYGLSLLLLQRQLLVNTSMARYLSIANTFLLLCTSIAWLQKWSMPGTKSTLASQQTQYFEYFANAALS